MENAVKKLRIALGLSQQALATIIGRSYQSVRNYERSLEAIPPDLRDRLAELATGAGLGELARDLRAERSAAKPGSVWAQQVSSRFIGWRSCDDRKRWHAMLDHVLDSGMQDAISAVRSVLLALEAYVRKSPQPAQPTAAKKKRKR